MLKASQPKESTQKNPAPSSGPEAGSLRNKKPTPQWEKVFNDAYGSGNEHPAMGYCYVVARHGKVVDHGASGLTRSAIDGNTPWTINSRCNLESISKSITAVAYMTAYVALKGTENELPLDASFRSYIMRNPELKDVAENNEHLEQVTVQDLLKMLSGLEHQEIIPGTGPGDIVPFLKDFLKKELAGTPGVTYNYSDANFVILEELLNIAAPYLGYEGYVDYVEQVVLTPMGIDTGKGGFNIDRDAEQDATLAYSDAKDAEHGWYIPPVVGTGAGGWIAPASELIKFPIGLRRHGKVLGKRWRSYMLTNQLGWYTWSGAYGDYRHHDGGTSRNVKDETQGLVTGLVRFTKGYDAVLFVNSHEPDNPTIPTMVKAFEGFHPLDHIRRVAK